MTEKKVKAPQEVKLAVAPKKKTMPKADPEALTITRLTRLLAVLDPHARLRVLNYQLQRARDEAHPPGAATPPRGVSAVIPPFPAPFSAPDIRPPTRPGIGGGEF